MENIEMPGAHIARDLTFLSEAEADSLFSTLIDHVEWEQRDVEVYGRIFPQPRLTAWFGQGNYSYSGLSLKARPMPEPIEALRQQVEARTGGVFNSVLLNRYVAGKNHGIGFHSDNEPELGRDPVIAMVTLGEGRGLHFKPKAHHQRIMPELEPNTQIETPHGSLLLMAGALQRNWTHGLPKKVGRKDRITLTFRKIIGD